MLSEARPVVVVLPGDTVSWVCVRVWKARWGLNFKIILLSLGKAE